MRIAKALIDKARKCLQGLDGGIINTLRRIGYVGSTVEQGELEKWKSEAPAERDYIEYSVRAPLVFEDKKKKAAPVARTVSPEMQEYRADMKKMHENNGGGSIGF